MSFTFLHLFSATWPKTSMAWQREIFFQLLSWYGTQISKLVLKLFISDLHRSCQFARNCKSIFYHFQCSFTLQALKISFVKEALQSILKCQTCNMPIEMLKFRMFHRKGCCLFTSAINNELSSWLPRKKFSSFSK